MLLGWLWMAGPGEPGPGQREAKPGRQATLGLWGCLGDPLQENPVISDLESLGIFEFCKPPLRSLKRGPW